MTIAEKIEMRKQEIKASFEAFEKEFAAVNSRIDATTAALNAVETKRGSNYPQSVFANTEATVRCFREMQEEIKRNNEEFQRFVDQSIMNHQF